MMKSILVLASAGALTMGIPLSGVSGSTAVTAGAQGRLQLWMRQVSMDVSLSTSARINVMLKAANQDGMSALTAIGHHQRGMAYQEASAMAKAMLVAEAWWQRDHLSASSSDATGLKTSLQTLASVKTKLAADGWWNSQSRLARDMTAAWVKGSALLTTTTATGTSATTYTQSSVQGRSHATIVTQTSLPRTTDQVHRPVSNRAVVSGATASPSSSPSTATASTQQMQVQPHHGLQANLGLSAKAGAQVGSYDNFSPTASNLQGKSNTGLQANVNLLGQLGF